MTKQSVLPVVTIDGPSGSGKGTIGKLLAKKLGWNFLDSGALYRALALAALRQPIDLTNETALEQLAKKLNVRFDNHVWLEEQAVTDAIRTEACGEAASKISVFPGVRTALLERQRAFCQPPGLVADGRDMGTVVFPDAILKFFLDASFEVRATRRYQQLKDKGQNVTLQALLEEIALRDARDKDRVTAPLKPAKDAVVIDTTCMGVEEVFTGVLNTVQRCLLSV